MEAQTIASLTEFLGWTLVINLGILMFSSMAIVIFRSGISNIHGKLFGMTELDLGRAYFQYLAQYKIAILVFNLAPYVALKIISA